MLSKMQKTINIILLIILIPILIISTVLIIKSYIYKDEVPSILGYSPLIVLSGSMENEIKTGDLIIVEKVNMEELKENDIIAFFSNEDRQAVITHRIINIIKNEDGKYEFITKGDKNEKEDSDKVKENLIVGKYNNTRFQGLGNVAIFLQTPTGIIISLGIPVGVIILLQYIQNRIDRKELEKLREKNNT